MGKQTKSSTSGGSASGHGTSYEPTILVGRTERLGRKESEFLVGVTRKEEKSWINPWDKDGESQSGYQSAYDRSYACADRIESKVDKPTFTLKAAKLLRAANSKSAASRLEGRATVKTFDRAGRETGVKIEHVPWAQVKNRCAEYELHEGEV